MDQNIQIFIDRTHMTRMNDNGGILLGDHGRAGNLVAGGQSAIKLELSTGKIQLNNGNDNLDVQMMADDGEGSSSS